MRESFELGRGLALMPGVAVASGGAFGCDIAAHHGVLDAGTRPAAAVVVFAGGLGCLYPRAHARIFAKLRERGAALLSERLWSAGCRPRDFAARNRIISGMAVRVFVMQAAARSGAAITARVATEQGREVSVLVHPERDVRAAGSRELLQDGAEPLASADEYLDRISPEDTSKAAQDTVSRVETPG
jgi:DNA processing protein